VWARVGGKGDYKTQRALINFEFEAKNSRVGLRVGLRVRGWV